MINPVIFEFNLLGLPIVLRWYGVLVMLGAVVGAFIAEREIKRRGENGESVWDALVWVLPAGIIGARLWYVLNNILGGSNYYTSNPAAIFKVWEGGLHFFGGLLFGGIALAYFLKQNGMDIWLFLDAIAPAALIGQALARPANFINQELYGQPTKLPWGIPIDAQHRLLQFSNLTQYPVETTRFHPTFAYEMILNILAALLLLWIARSYVSRIKPGSIFAGWLILAGLARTIIEFFRPDQPKIGNTFITTSMLVSFLMAVAGVVMLLIRYGKFRLALAEGWEEQYQIKPVEKKSPARSEKTIAGDVVEDEVDQEAIAEPEMKKRTVKAKATVKKTSTKKASEEKKTPAKRTGSKVKNVK
jgi:phosphatidylglycerol:prolipoprotein diacylglycerol transferase